MSMKGPYPTPINLVAHVCRDPQFAEDTTALRVVMAMCELAATTARCRCAMGDLAAGLEVEPTEASRAIYRLEARGYMAVTPIGDGTYEFAFPFIPEDRPPAG